MAPGWACARQQPLSEQGPQDPQRRWRAGVVLMLVHENMPDCIGSVQEKAGPSEGAAADDILVVGPLGPDPKVVGADGRDDLPERQVVGSRIRCRGRDTPASLGWRSK